MALVSKTAIHVTSNQEMKYHMIKLQTWQMWYLQKSASDFARISSKMALKDTDLWWLTAF